MGEENHRTNEFIKLEEKVTKLTCKNEESLILLSQENDQLKEQLDLLKKRDDETQDRVDKLKLQVDELNIRVNTLTKHFRIQGNIHVWKIDNWSEKVKYAVQEKTLAIFSPEYYTAAPTGSAPTGYKFILALFPNGDGMGRRTHVSVYFAIMKGDFDQLLTWPFKGKVTLTLLDPSGYAKHHVLKFPAPSHNRVLFAQPTKEKNNGVGFPQFIKRDEIDYYLHQNTLYLQVEIK